MDSWHSTNGYGYASDKILESLHALGYEVKQNDPSADVQFWFDQPQHWKWNNEHQYRIGYHPWESTKLQRGWKKKMNECDEIWTPSPIVAQWYRDTGVAPPVYVYQHGIDHDIWVRRKRIVTDKMKFLHVGGEALRKGLPETIRAFKAAFPNNEDVELVLKQNQDGWNIPEYGRTKVIVDLLSLQDLVALYHECHVFVYPSWGEGFGLNPLQAMGTGMPTVTTDGWAPYSHLIPDSQRVNSTLTDSPWPKVHPGKMWKPDFDDLVDKLRFVHDHYHSEAEYSYQNAEKVHDEYDWIKFTDQAFSDLQKRLESR